MNWIGGTLQRTKHANKGVIQKQRAYFARARTQLKQSPGTPAVPFRPDYLLDGDGHELGHYLPTFGSGSVRHTGHLARKRREVERAHPSSAIQKSQRLIEPRKSQETSLHFLQGRRNSAADNGM